MSARRRQHQNAGNYGGTMKLADEPLNSTSTLEAKEHKEEDLIYRSQVRSERRIRVLLCGPPRSGKRSIIGWFLRYLNTNQDRGPCCSITSQEGEVVESYPVLVNGEPCIYSFQYVSFECGQSTYAQTESHIQNADVVLLILSAGSSAEVSKELLSSMIKLVEEMKAARTVVVTLVNKADLSDAYRHISDEEISTVLDPIARPHSLYEVSAFDGTLLAEILEEVAIDWLSHKKSEKPGVELFATQPFPAPVTSSRRDCRCFCIRFTFW